MRDTHLSVRPDIRTVQEGVPCFDPGRVDAVGLCDGAAGASRSRYDGLRARLGITTAQTRYANRQVRSGPNIGTINPGVGA